MSTVLSDTLPDHNDLPDTDGKPLENSIEQLQNSLLTQMLEPILKQLHPDGQYFIGHDVGIYYDPTNPNLGHCKAPDWFYIPNVSPLEPNDGTYRRSYVMWKENYIPPYFIIEQVSSKGGAEERDRTPEDGKMWVYENVLKVPVYAIFEGFKRKAGEGKLEVYHLINGRYVKQKPDDKGRYLIPSLDVLLGIEDRRQIKQMPFSHPWLRFYDLKGKALHSYDEQAETLKKKTQAEHQGRLEATKRAQEEERARMEAEKQVAEMQVEIAKLKNQLRQQEKQ